MIFRLSLKTIHRENRSSVSAAAYRAGARLYDERAKCWRDHTRKTGVVATRLIGWDGERAALWNAAEHAEKRAAARVAREALLTLPRELSPRDRERCAVTFARWLRERFGVACDVAMHDPGKRGSQPHAHILFTTRRVDGGTFGAKTRELDQRTTSGRAVEEMRCEWCRVLNDALAIRHHTQRLDHRSYQRQGVAKEGQYLDREQYEREKRGDRSGSMAAPSMVEHRRKVRRQRVRRAAAQVRACPPVYFPQVDPQPERTPEPTRQSTRDAMKSRVMAALTPPEPQRPTALALAPARDFRAATTLPSPKTTPSTGQRR